MHISGTWIISTNVRLQISPFCSRKIFFVFFLSFKIVFVPGIEIVSIVVVSLTIIKFYAL